MDDSRSVQELIDDRNRIAQEVHIGQCVALDNSIQMSVACENLFLLPSSS